MPTIQNVVLTDRATTPVNHTFTPVNRIGEDGLIVAESNGTKVGEPRLSIFPAKGGDNGAKYKSRLLFVVPTVATETVNGVSYPKVVRNAVIEATFSFDKSSTLQERADCVGMFASGLAANKVLVNDVIVKLEGIYG